MVRRKWIPATYKWVQENIFVIIVLYTMGNLMDKFGWFNILCCDENNKKT